MIKYYINPQDDRYLFLDSDKKEEIKALSDYLNKIPSYMFLPSYSSIPKPEIHLDTYIKNDKKYRFCFSGLYLNIIEWCKNNNIQTTLRKNLFAKPIEHNFEEFKKIVSSWNLSLKPYDYQLEAAWKILNYKQSLSQIATRGGKTLISYIIFRYAKQFLNVHKILMIVPSVMLVKQGVRDFQEYSDIFKINTVWAKGEAVPEGDITIGTFQSLVKKCDRKSSHYDPKFFDQFDCVLVDEVHNAKAASIKIILQQPFMRFIKFKFGFSGTLPIENTLESFSVQELMGGKIQDITPKELIDEGYISDILIQQIRIQHESMYTEPLCKVFEKCGEYLCGNFVEQNGKKILLPTEQRCMCMIHEKNLPYTIRQLKNHCSKEEYINYIINVCKAQGSNLLTLENYVTHFSDKKKSIIKDIVKNSNDGNIILFFHYNEYCKYIYEFLKQEFPNRKVFIMTGSTSMRKREEYKKIMSESNDVVLCANYGVSSTGLTLRLKYGCFVESFKSHVIVKQSAGRGLCLDPGNKDYFKLYDLIDVFPDTKRIYFQGIQKIKLYKQEGFKYNIEKI